MLILPSCACTWPRSKPAASIGNEHAVRAEDAIGSPEVVDCGVWEADVGHDVGDFPLCLCGLDRIVCAFVDLHDFGQHVERFVWAVPVQIVGGEQVQKMRTSRGVIEVFDHRKSA